MKKNMISVVVPVYNEEGVVKETVEQLDKVMKSTKIPYEIIIVNDYSKDNSRAILSSISYVKNINHIRNKGYGASLKTGITAAKGDWILITDADGTYPIDKIPDLAKYMDQYDMVVGSRTGKNVQIPFFRRPAKKFLTGFASFLANHKIPDLNSGLRMFKKDLVLEFWSLFPEKFSFTSTITMAALINNYDVKYVPIDYYRRQGKSSIKPIRDFVGFTNLLFRLVVYFRPLKVFLPTSIFIFLLGLIFLIFQVVSSKNISDLSILLILSGIQIGFMGILADLVIKRIK